MNIRVASAIFGLLLLAVAVGWCALPDIPTTAAPTTTVYVETLHTAPEGSAVSTSAIIIGGLVSGAAMIGLIFFSPSTGGSRPTAGHGSCAADSWING
ncbi:hypothetical protein, partial [Nocardia brasiliensis]|uniref:hypothetical protein n=1 Tax=Nocardia brasiliensis TaxID=37326 RepID=UPI0024578797